MLRKIVTWACVEENPSRLVSWDFLSEINVFEYLKSDFLREWNELFCAYAGDCFPALIGLYFNGEDLAVGIVNDGVDDATSGGWNFKAFLPWGAVELLDVVFCCGPTVSSMHPQDLFPGVFCGRALLK